MASLIVGLVQIIFAAVAVIPNDREPLYVALAARGVNVQWAIIMGCFGFMIVYGSLRPKRKCRQMGLALSPFILFAVFGVAMTSGWLSMTTLLVMFFAVIAPVLMVADTFQYVQGRLNEGH